MPASATQGGCEARMDPLEYLPNRRVETFRCGQVIFNSAKPSRGIHLVVTGAVMLQFHGDDGAPILADIHGKNEFFGESGLLRKSVNALSAVVLEEAAVMSWSAGEILERIASCPNLGLALIQIMAERSFRDQERLVGLLLEKAPQRLVRSLLDFADRLGTAREDGSVRIPPLSHQLIAEYVAVSREIVTIQMNRLKKRGLVRYSRKEIILYPQALSALLAPPIPIIRPCLQA